MEIYRSLAELPNPCGRAVATIGNFDGVHRGHRWVIEQVSARARALGARSLVITFDPHPARAIRPDAAQPLITPTDQKLRLLASTGVDAVLVLPFNGELARMTARAFAEHVLAGSCGIVELHEGENFRFGHKAEADVDTLEELGRDLGFSVQVYPPRHAGRECISSSRIRSLIAAGDVSKARKLLGRPFAIESTPASGRGYGSRYTVPTINLAPYPELVPGNGVYITLLRVGEDRSAETFEAVTNVGNRPTFGADSFAIESHLLNFHPVELYELTPLCLCFLERLRSEIRFPDPESLLGQIRLDVRRAQRYFTLRQALASKAMR